MMHVSGENLFGMSHFLRVEVRSGRGAGGRGGRTHLLLALVV